MQEFQRFIVNKISELDASANTSADKAKKREVIYEAANEYLAGGEGSRTAPVGKIPVPSCVKWFIREKLPDPRNYYNGYYKDEQQTSESEAAAVSNVTRLVS